MRSILILFFLSFTVVFAQQSDSVVYYKIKSNYVSFMDDTLSLFINNDSIVRSKGVTLTFASTKFEKYKFRLSAAGGRIRIVDEEKHTYFLKPNQNMKEVFIAVSVFEDDKSFAAGNFHIKLNEIFKKSKL